MIALKDVPAEKVRIVAHVLWPLGMWDLIPPLEVTPQDVAYGKTTADTLGFETDSVLFTDRQGVETLVLSVRDASDGVVVTVYEVTEVK